MEVKVRTLRTLEAKGKVVEERAKVEQSVVLPLRLRAD